MMALAANYLQFKERPRHLIISRRAVSNVFEYHYKITATQPHNSTTILLRPQLTSPRPNCAVTHFAPARDCHADETAGNERGGP